MIIKPFKGIRPTKEKVKAVASRPYDVLDSEEARKEAEGNPFSFLNVVKPEITLPVDVDHYSDVVYETGRDNFRKLIQDGVFVQDKEECIYLYELTMAGKSQVGIVACASIEDYFEGKIKKHELTRPDKELDRKKHVRVSMINAEPVFFAYLQTQTLDELVSREIKNNPEYDFTAEDGIQHRFWVVRDPNVIGKILVAFENMEATYVADGHHRTAAAALVGQDLKKENSAHTGDEEYNYFLAVHFPDNQLRILDYNRVVKDLNGLDGDLFLKALGKSFQIKKVGKAHKPSQLHEFGMYLEGSWYALEAKEGTYNNNDPIGVLDVTILSEEILKPILNIHDLRTDKRIEFVGGMRGLGELEKRVNSGNMKVAFALYPVSIEQLVNISDSGAIMPPKTTWFEPKLRSGLVVHSLV